MNILPLALVAASLLPDVVPTPAPRAPVGADALCESACPSARIDAARVQASLNDLLASEGLGATRAGVAVIRRIDLDGDASTQEVLVDVISMEHCVAAACETLVVRATPAGDLVTMGHGKSIGTLGSRSGGWIDLSVHAFPGLPVGALRFSSVERRYR